MKSLNVNFDESNMVSIFTGEQFYESWKVFVRELLQNAYDACYARQALEWSWGTEFLELEQAQALNSMRHSYLPRIVVSYNSSTGMFYVEDNGIGINEADLELYVAKIGSCYYTSEAYRRQRLDYEPVSQFGIGLFSCFRVSRAVLIESKKAKSINTAWNIDDKQSLEPIAAKWFKGKDKIEYITSNRKLVGTRVTLALLPQYARHITMNMLVECIEHYMMSQPIPIDIYFDKQKVTLDRPKMKAAPFTFVAGVTLLLVDTELLEGYILLYHSQHKHLIGESVLYQQGFRVVEDVDSVGLKPVWLRNMAFCLNVKKKFLHLTLSRNMVIDDANRRQLRDLIGQMIVNYYSDNAIGLTQYIQKGTHPILTDSECEMQMLYRSVFVQVYRREQQVEIAADTIVNGFMGKKVRMAYMTHQLFEYYKNSYPMDFKNFLNHYDIVIFEQSRESFTQLMAPYITKQEYIVTELPGIVYIEVQADFQTRRKVAPYKNNYRLYPESAVDPLVFCFVTNEQSGALKLNLNRNHRNVRLLEAASYNPKVCYFKEVLMENIKQRIINSKHGWDKIIDFGGSFVDEWTSPELITVQSIWCLEDDFAQSVNQFMEKQFNAAELTFLGLDECVFFFFFFIDWWYSPK